MRTALDWKPKRAYAVRARQGLVEYVRNRKLRFLRNRSHGRRVKVRAPALGDDLHRLLVRERLLLHAPGAERFVHVRQRHEARPAVVSPRPPALHEPAAVPLMVVPGDVHAEPQELVARIQLFSHAGQRLVSQRHVRLMGPRIPRSSPPLEQQRAGMPTLPTSCSGLAWPWIIHSPSFIGFSFCRKARRSRHEKRKWKINTISLIS